MKRNALILIISLVLFYSSSALSQTISKADTASGAMVVAAHPDAVNAGAQILEQGGNAVDAAVAMAFVIGVVEPHASGLGGGGAMLVYEKEEDVFHYLDYYMKTSQQVDSVFNSRDKYSAKSVCVPGTPSGLITAHRNYGRLSLKEVMEPAIKIARRGLIVDSHFEGSIMDKLDVIMLFPETAKLFLKDEFPPVVGDTLHNSELVTVLEGLSEQGINYFYTGDFAKKLSADIQTVGGYLTEEDFSQYKTEFRAPLHTDYHGHTITSAPPPQSGSTLLEILNIYEESISSDSASFIKDAAQIHILSEAIKRADTDRFYFLADPAFFQVPAYGLINKKYAAKRFSDIDTERIKYPDSKKIAPGNPWDFQNHNTIEPARQTVEDAPHTTHISVIDKEGNAVSLTQTLGYFFGSGFSSQGILLNSSMTNFYKKPSPNRLGPGRRPLTTISPTMVFKDGKLRIVVGTPGGGRVFNVLAQLIIRMLDFQQGPVEAMDAPRFSIRRTQKKLQMEGRFSSELIEQLKTIGYEIKKYPNYDNYFGGVQLIYYDKKSGNYIGVSDPRRNGGALGIDK